MTLTFTRHTLSRFSAIIFVIIGFFVSAPGQSTRRTTDGFTPSDILGGGDEIGKVNIFSRTVNLDLPLASLQGRGGQVANFTETLDASWIIEENIPETGGPEYYAYNVSFGENVPRLQGERITFFSYPGTVCPSGAPPSSSILTRFRLHMPDGTEYVFHDTAQNGDTFTVPNVCAIPLPTNNRGRIFITSDATAATLIMDSDVIDKYMQQGLGSDYDYALMDGTVFLKDGTRYRFVDNKLEYIQDRNGNRFTYQFELGAGPITSITDSVGRKIDVIYNWSTNIKTIRTKGFNGATRDVKIYYAEMGTALRTDYPTTKTYQQLFPGSYGQAQPLPFNPYVITRIELPNGKSYFFYYNTYGEVARVILPIGGGYDYEYPDGGWIGVIYVHRPSTRRTVYSTLDASTDPQNPPAANVVRKEFFSASDLGDGTRIVTVETKDGNNTLVTQSRHYFINASNFGCPPYQYPSWSKGKEFKTEQFQVINGSLGPVLTTVEHTYDPPLIPNVECSNPPWPNPKIVETKTTLNDLNLVSRQTYNYDAFHNMTDVYEYGFGTGAPGPLFRRTHTDYLTTNPYQPGFNYATDLNIHIRNLPTFVQVFDGNNNELSRTNLDYDRYNNDPPLELQLQNCPDIVQHDGVFDTDHKTRGNLVKYLRWLLPNPENPNLIEIKTFSQYDIAGNVVKTIDALGNETLFDYSDRYGSANGEAQSNELTGLFTYAFPTKVTNELGHETYTQYDYYLGKPVDSEDPNGAVTSFSYNDPLDRLKQVVRAANIASVKNQTTYSYNDTARRITTTSDLNTINDNKLKGEVLYDGLGRTIESRQYETASGYIVVNTVYDALGRTKQVSNPHRSGDPVLWTTTDYDALSRVTRMTTPDGAQVNNLYSGNEVTVTDQASKKRRSKIDALGRLTEVIEDPGGLGHVTTYFYDALDNLRKVCQGWQTQVCQGGQTRKFAYDSLSRLIRAYNPEHDINNDPNMSYNDPLTPEVDQWSMAYKYDANGNLTEKRDARNIITSYEYDALNRNTIVNYSNTTVNPDIVRQYDGATNGKGRPWGDYAGGYNPTDQEGEHNAIISYDALGRPLTRSHLFKVNGVWSVAYSVSQTYDLAGNIKTVTYPSGRTVNYSYDDAGRLTSFSGNLGDGVSRTYSTITQYHPAGMIERETFGTQTPLYHKKRYNNRFQLGDLRLSTVNDVLNRDRGALLFYHGPNAVTNNDPFRNDLTNNGNLLKQEHYVPTAGGGEVVPQRDDYTYDALNRISSVVEPNGYTQNFAYDQWGNRRVTSATGVGISNYNPTYDTSKNRINGLTYDAAGNITNDVNTGGTMTYDAENRLLTATAGGGGSYTYDADGRRTRRTAAGQTTWHVYGIGGELLAEYAANGAPSAPQKEYGYRGGQLLIVAESGSGGMSFVRPDSQSSVDIAKKTDRPVDGNEDGLFIANESDADLEFGEGPGSTATDDSDNNSSSTFVGGLTWTTTREYDNALLFNGIGGKLFAEYAADAGTSVPQKEYSYRGGEFLITAESRSSGNSPGKLISQSSAELGGKTGRARSSNAIAPLQGGGPVIALGFNEGTGTTTADASGNNNDGTLIGGVTWTTAGAHGKALSFNGSNGVVQITDSPSWNVNGLTGYTISMWVKVKDVSTDYRVAIGKGAWPSDDIVIYKEGNHWDFGIWTSGNWKCGGLTSPLTYLDNVDNNYHHIAVSMDASAGPNGQCHFYSDGVIVGTDEFVNGTTNFAPGNNLYIGGSDGSQYINADIDEVRVYTRALTQAEIVADKDTPIGGGSGDTTPPVISNVAAGSITATSATITWTTNEPADSQVMYRTAQGAFQSTPLNTSLETAHSENLSGLLPGTLYYYKVISKDAAGNSTMSPESGELSFTTAQSGSSGGIKWIVADHLGSTRMVVDASGSLAGITRKDFAPFGEELSAGLGIRTADLGYSPDSVRQKFGSKERDETNLDFFGARFFSSTQGRFTSTDEFKGGPHALWVLGSGDPEKQALVYADITNPQSLNKYQYCFNNPLRYVDPDGQAPQDELGMEAYLEYMLVLEGKMTKEEYEQRQKARQIGTGIGVGIVLGVGIAYIAPHVGTAVIGWILRNPATIIVLGQEAYDMAIGNPFSLPRGKLTITMATRLSAQEISTGGRLARQEGLPLIQSADEAVDYINPVTKKTYDAMLGPRAYQNWSTQRENVFAQIKKHLIKANFVAIDLKGASKAQIKEIEQYVSTLPEADQARIIYVR